MKKHQEILTFTHKAIPVTVHIDYDKGIVSLIENEYQNYTVKHWIFQNRGLEYMQSWQNILDSMKYAVAEATKLLEHDLAEESKFKEEIIVKAFKKKV